jgi:hypothetical protein
MSDEVDVQFTPASDAEVKFTPSSDFQSAGSRMGTGSQESTMDQAKDRVEGLVDRAQGRVKDAAESRLSAGKSEAVDRLSDVAQGLRSSGQQFQGQEAIGHFVTRAADRVESFANHLRNRDVPELIEEVEDFARRQPAAFLGGAFAVGLIGARFLKSSRDNQVEEGVRDRWSTQRMTSRTPHGEDAVGRPNAPGYERPSERMS